MDQEYVCKEQLAPPCQKLLRNWKLLLYLHSYIPICQQFLPCIHTGLTSWDYYGHCNIVFVLLLLSFWYTLFV